jgi:5-methylcytosine-specific restriction endonuclease McrA
MWIADRSDIMTEEERSVLVALVRAGRFYESWAWKTLRAQVLAEHKGECQICKSRGLFRHATVVHHVQYTDRHPELALSRTYEYGGKEYQNLVPVCRDCHERLHNHRRKPDSCANDTKHWPEKW